MKINDFRRLSAALGFPLLLWALVACGGPGPTTGDGDKPGSPITRTSVDVSGRVVIPLDLLAEDLEYDAVFKGTMVWLFDQEGEPVANVQPDPVGAFTFEEVAAAAGGYRLVAIIGSGSDAVTMETSITEPGGSEGTIHANITAETTISAELARDPELAAEYDAKVEATMLASYDEGVEPITAADLNPGDFALIGFDESSLADGLPGDAPAAGLSTMATGTKRVGRCEWEGMLWWAKKVCNYIRVPDLVVKIPDPLASSLDPLAPSLAPRLIPFTVLGTEIVKKVTDAERRVAMRINAAGEMEFFSNGIIATGGGNIISTGGLNIISTGGGNIIAAGGGNIISTGGLNIEPSFAGDVLRSGQAALFEPQGGRYGGDFAMVSVGLVSRINDNARLAQFAAGQINAQQLMSNISANIISTGGGNVRRIQSVGEPVTEPEAAKAVVADPKPAYTQDQIDEVIQAFSPPRIHKVASTRASNGPEIDRTPGGKLFVQASYVDAATMVGVWTGNWTGYELVDIEPYGTIDGHYQLAISSLIPAGVNEAKLTVVKLPENGGHPGEARLYSNTETVVFDPPRSFELALLLDDTEILHAGEYGNNPYAYSLPVQHSSSGHVFHDGQKVSSADLLFRFGNREPPVNSVSPDGVLSAFSLPSSSLSRYPDPDGGRAYYRLPLKIDVLGQGRTPNVIFESPGLHSRFLYLLSEKVSISPGLEVVSVDGFDENDYPKVQVRITAGTEQVCDPLLSFYDQPNETIGGRGKMYDLCVEAGEELVTVLTFDQEPKLAPGTYYVALSTWDSAVGAMKWSNYQELIIGSEPTPDSGTGTGGFSISGQIPDWSGETANVRAFAHWYDAGGEPQGVSLADQAIDSDGAFNLTLPAVVEESFLTIFDYSESGCSNELTVFPADTRSIAVYGLDITSSNGSQLGFTYQASRALADEANERVDDKTLVGWIYVDRDVTVNGQRSCSHEGNSHTISASNLTLYQGWNPVTTVIRELAPRSEELSGDVTGVSWYRVDFSGF